MGGVLEREAVLTAMEVVLAPETEQRCEVRADRARSIVSELELDKAFEIGFDLGPSMRKNEEQERSIQAANVLLVYHRAEVFAATATGSKLRRSQIRRSQMRWTMDQHGKVALCRRPR